MRRIALHQAALACASIAAATLLSPISDRPASAAPPSLPTSGHGPVAATTEARAHVRRWTVVKSSPGTYVVAWSSPTRLPYTDARPEVLVDGRSVGRAIVSADRRTVSAAIASAPRPNSAQLDVRLGRRILDHESTAVSGSPRVPYRLPAGVTELSVDPGSPGYHAIATSDYTLDPVRLPDIPKLVEMVGHVVAPADATDTSPLVLFLHGRHQPCYKPRHGEPSAYAQPDDPRAWRCDVGAIPVPSYLGYEYVQRLLASQGYVTVSISANAINALDIYSRDGGAAARAALIRRHLRAWSGFVGAGEQHADLDNVILVGHSRGGEGANRAALNLAAGIGSIAGQVLIGATDFGFQAAPYTPTVTVLPYCDGDVYDLQGQNFTDDARDLVEGPIAFHSSALVMGANHNFFNTEWTPGISRARSADDWFGPKRTFCGRENPYRLTAGEQRKVAKAYIAGAVHLFANDEQAVLPMFDGSAVSVPSALNADVRTHAIGGGLDVVRPGVEASVGEVEDASMRLCLGVSAARRRTACQPGADSAGTPHWPSRNEPGVPLRSEFEMRWSQRGQAAAVQLSDGWDLSDEIYLDLRTIVDAGLGPVRLDVRLVDSAGRSAVLTPVGGGTLWPLPAHPPFGPTLWAQTLRVRLDDLVGVDPSDIVAVDLISRTDEGRVWIVDMSAASATGITEPPGEIPTISLGKTRQDEGDGPGDATFAVHYHVTGDLGSDATITVATVEYQPFGTIAGSPEKVVVPAHTTDGTLTFSYTPNDARDYRGRRNVNVIAYGVHGIQTDRYIGTATLIDDDPAAVFAIRPVDRRVVEGDTARWRLRLTAPLAFSTYWSALPVRAVDGKQLTYGDLPKRFRERHHYGRGAPSLNTPLPKAELGLLQRLPAGRTSVVIAVPIRRTKSHDGLRALSMRFEMFGFPRRVVSTVMVGEPQP